MSTSEEKDSWLERWWPLFVILYGVVFVLIIDNFAPFT